MYRMIATSGLQPVLTPCRQSVGGGKAHDNNQAMVQQQTHANSTQLICSTAALLPVQHKQTTAGIKASKQLLCRMQIESLSVNLST
jgi:hypothetical protein